MPLEWPLQHTHLSAYSRALCRHRRRAHVLLLGLLLLLLLLLHLLAPWLLLLLLLPVGQHLVASNCSICLAIATCRAGLRLLPLLPPPLDPHVCVVSSTAGRPLLCSATPGRCMLGTLQQLLQS
jgi:hypothetical protein